MQEQGTLDCPASLTDTSDLADCVIDRAECGVERLVVASAPRASELLAALGRNVGGEFPCLATAASTKGANGGGAGLPDADDAKTAVKCQSALLKAGVKLGKVGSKAVQKCADAAAACIQLKPNDAACKAKTSSKCVTTFAKLNSNTGTFFKLLIATAGKCATTSFGTTELNDPAGLGFSAVTDPGERCSQFTLLNPFQPGRTVECVGRQYLCEGAQLLEREAPRLREYADFLGIPTTAFGF
jgi:hypothetical protein